MSVTIATLGAIVPAAPALADEVEQRSGLDPDAADLIRGWSEDPELERDPRATHLLELREQALLARLENWGAAQRGDLVRGRERHAGSATPMPEPGAALSFAAGLILARLVTRKRRS